ncbi:MAG: riboflavin synthase [Alphaproteobacteria bacterium]|nr:riboflavin synthase [Alphaproteobacteria bacterium]
MFSGIVKDLGRIEQFSMPQPELAQDAIMQISTKLPMEKLILGASVACDGVCLTVTESSAKDGVNFFTVQLSQESLKVIKPYIAGGAINLEPALTLADGLDGHLVSGHVDGIAELRDVQHDAGSRQMVFSAPKQFSAFIMRKGSVCLNGVSLTVNDVSAPDAKQLTFGCNIISHTANVTNLGDLQAGDSLNIEIDLLARYMERFLSVNRSN